MEELEGEQEQNQSDLKIALKRIHDLQAALEEDLDSDADGLASDRLVLILCLTVRSAAKHSETSSFRKYSVLTSL